MKPLVQHHGELSNYMMEWIRAWLNPQMENVKCHICSPYLGPLLYHILRSSEETP